MIINKIIIWGYKLHSHTHSYIHYGYYKAFKYLGYDTHWFDKNDDISSFDFANSFFLTAGQLFKGIPIREDCFYFLHNVDNSLHDCISKEKKLVFQVYTHDCIGRDIQIEGKKLHYYTPPPNNTIYSPWATDLLPFEIDNIMKNLNNIKPHRKIYFVGSITHNWKLFKKVCNKYKIPFLKSGGATNYRFGKISPNDNIKIIQQSLIAPAIQSDWQVEHGYIPCRIFKNISYGRMGLTNNPTVYDLFNNKIIYDKNIESLLKKGIAFENRRFKNKIVKNLMVEVKNKHTYINRINLIKWYLTKFLDINL